LKEGIRCNRPWLVMHDHEKCTMVFVTPSHGHCRLIRTISNK